MKYLCLAYEEESKLNALSKSEWDSLRDETLAYVDELRSSGCLFRQSPFRASVLPRLCGFVGGR